MKNNFFLYVFFSFLFLNLFNINAQGYTPPSYCNSFSVANGQNNWGIGIRNFTCGTINNTTTTSSAASALYFDFSNLTDTGYAGSVQNWSIIIGASNRTIWKIYIDWNNDGIFNTSGIELAYAAPAYVNATATPQTGTFTVPVAQSPGAYRIRVTSGNFVSPPPCGPIDYNGDIEDYTFVVLNTLPDATVAAVLAPSTIIPSPAINPVSFRIINTTNIPMTSVSAGYKVNGGAANTQTFTGLNIAPGASYTISFGSGFTAPIIGNYQLIYWLYNVNGSIVQATPLNDTIYKTRTLYCTAPLSGVYTIDSAGSGPTNFKSFAIADSNLITCGISGPVTFNVSSQIFNEQIWLPAITGSSSTNTITFNGAGKGKTIVTFNTTNANPHVLRLDDCSFVTFKKMTLRSTTATNNAWVAHFVNGTNNRINNCVIEMTGASATAANNTLYGIAISGSASSAAFNSSGNNILVDSCVINNGFYGVYSQSVLNSNVFSFLNDTFNNPYAYGIYANNSHIIKFNFNSLNMRMTNSTSSGIYFVNNSPSGSNYHEIRNNSIYNAGQYGIYFSSSSGSGAAYGQIYNNIISGFRAAAGTYGIYNSNSSRWQVWHNTINLDFASTSGTSACVYLNGGSLFDIQNNILSISNNSIFNAFPFYTNNTTAVSVLDYNLYNNKSSTNLLNIAGLIFTPSNFKFAFPIGGGVNSNSNDPAFISSSDLHSSNGCNNGTNLGIAVDIDGDVRGVAPDMGADEVTNFSINEIQVLSITNPSFPYALGSQPLTVIIRNNGVNTINALFVNYVLNNGTVVTEPYTGAPIPTCGTANFTFASNPTIIAGSNILKVFTTFPNGNNDTFPANDTSIAVFCPALSGTYTIGTGLDYSNFSAAANALNCGGIAGSVNFLVANGTYTEQFVLNQILGASAANTITFQSASGIATNVTLQFNGGSSILNNYVVKMNGSDFIIWKNMTLQSTNTSYSNLLLLLNNPLNNTFQNVVFTGPAGSFTSQNNALVFANNGALNNLGQGDDNNTFTSCIFNNGSYGLYLSGNYGGTYSRGLNVNNCAFNNQYYMAAYLYFHFNYNFSRNTIITNSAYSNFYGFYHYGGGVANSSPVTINRNRISAPSANGYGMFIQYLNGAANADLQVMNNMINIGIGAAAVSYGMYLQYCMAKIYHNTVNITSGNLSSMAAYVYAQSYQPAADVKFNIFANSGNGLASGYCIYSYIPNLTYLLMDSNVYYQGAGPSNVGQINGTNYANITTWKTGMGASWEQNSLALNPNFISATNPHISTAANVRTVPRRSFVTEDIDGARCGSFTETGADFHPGANDVGVSSISNPLNGVASPGLANVSVVLKNYGSNTITSANITYNINGTIVTEPWAGSLNICDSVVYTFSVPYNFTVGYTIKAYSSLPNGLADALIANDSTNLVGCIGFTGDYFINRLGSGARNYTSFSAAIAAMQSCGLTGPVRFAVAADTYREKVTIPLISGSSSINTITFDGGTGNAASRIIQSKTTLASPSIVLFNTTANVIVKNLTINTSSIYDHYNVNFFNSTNCKLIACILSDSANVSDPAVNSNSFRVLIGGAANSVTSSSICNNIYIDSNTLNMGYYSINAQMNNGNNTIYIRYNLLSRASMGVMYLVGAQTLKIIGNRFRPKLYGSNWNPQFGVNIQNANPISPLYHEILYNISDSVYGQAYQFANSSGSAGNYNVFANNMIYGQRYSNSSYINNSSSYWKIYHNSISLDFTTNGTSSCYNQSAAIANSIDIRNNIFSVSNSLQYGAIPVLISNASYLSNFDFNDLFNGSGFLELMKIGSINYYSPIAYPNGIGANSKNVNPQFLANNNLHIPNSKACIFKGTPVLGILNDIDYQTRSLVAPIMGADEVIGNSNDLSIESIASPISASINPGIVPITLVIRNVGVNTITSGKLTYIFNGGAPVTSNISSVLLPCDTMTITIHGLNMIAGQNTFFAFTSLPNATTDSYFGNDTIRSYFCTKLNGTYTIGGASPNFLSFTAAVDVLNCGGIAGPVIFKVRPGTYNEAVQINSILNSNDTNTVVFQSENGLASSVILQNNVLGSYTIKLYNADYLSLRNMTIRTSLTGTNPIQIISINDSANMISIYGNIINGNWFVSNNYAGIFVSGHTPNLSIRKNTFGKLSFAIAAIGNNIVGKYTQNCVIDSNLCNTALGDVFSGFNLSYFKAPMIKYNTIIKNGCCADQGITLSNISGAGEIAYNNLYTTAGFYVGINISNCNTNGETSPFLIYNNFVNQSSPTNTNNINIQSSNYVYVYNNSFNVNGTNTSPTAYNCYVNASANIRLVNNIFRSPTNFTNLYLNGGSLAAAKAQIAECNYNDYYQGSGSLLENVLRVYTTDYTSSTMQGAIASSPQNDINSLFYNPLFKSTTDLHLQPTTGLDGKGKYLSYFADDIDGQKRLSNNYDIGADDTVTIRTTIGDYVISSGCINISGNTWIDITDSFGKLVFSIHPQGSNLGATCWKVRIANPTDSIRKDSIINTVNGLKYYSTFLGRNLVISPTNIPTSKVLIRAYMKSIELQRLFDTSTAKFGYAMSNSNLKIHKFHLNTGNEGLTPLINAGINDSSTFLLPNRVGNYGTDKYIECQVSGFSQFNFVIPNSNPAILPVTWLSFNAISNGRDAVLTWSTASERNSKSFEIERSEDGIHYTNIGSVDAAGTSSQINNYTFIDKHAADLKSEKLYYRLKQNDLDGQFDYSKIRVVQFKGEDGIIVHSVSPNPFNTNVSADFTLLSKDQVNLTLTNIEGKAMKSIVLNGQKGDNNYTMNTEEFAAGIYILKIQSKDNQFVYKLIKN